MVELTPDGCEKPSFHAASFFEIDDADRIVAVTEYWATDEKPPERRRAGGWAAKR